MPLTESQIRAIFAPAAIQGSQGQFFEHVADDVDWSIMGSSPMSKRYRSKAEFQVETLKILKEKVLTEPLRVRVLHVIVGANEGPRDECEAAIELEAVDAVCKNGESPSSPFVGLNPGNQNPGGFGFSFGFGCGFGSVSASASASDPEIDLEAHGMLIEVYRCALSNAVSLGMQVQEGHDRGSQSVPRQRAVNQGH